MIDIPEENRLLGIMSLDGAITVCSDHREALLDTSMLTLDTHALTVSQGYGRFTYLYWAKFYMPEHWLVINALMFEGKSCRVCGRVLVQQRDFSTLNMDVLAALPAYNCPKSYEISSTYASGFLLPPGHWRYFAHQVYTKHGNRPHAGETLVLLDMLGVYHKVYEDGPIAWDLWAKLPLNHPRTHAWLKHILTYTGSEDAVRENAATYYGFDVKDIDMTRVKATPLDYTYPRGQLGAKVALEKA